MDLMYVVSDILSCLFLAALRPPSRKGPDLLALTYVMSDILSCLFLAALFFCVCFVAFRPKAPAMVMAGQSVHLTTRFHPGKLARAVNQCLVYILSLVTDNNPSRMI